MRGLIKGRKLFLGLLFLAVLALLLPVLKGGGAGREAVADLKDLFVETIYRWPRIFCGSACWQRP